jgi:alpha-1,2-mannosyltransferase
MVSLASITAGPAMWWRYWTDLLWQTDRVGSLGSGRNQSLAGLLTRLRNDDLHHAGTARPEVVLWAAAVALVLGVGLWRARRAWRAGDELGGFTLTGLTGCLLSPISWTHHLYWVVPALLLLVDRAAATRGRTRWRHLITGGAAFVLFTSGVIHHYWHWGGHHYDDGPVGVLGENAYVLGCLALLCLVPWRPAAPAPPPRDDDQLPARQPRTTNEPRPVETRS